MKVKIESAYYTPYPLNELGIKKRKEALHTALDIRKFEIELYWKRTTYFWAFIALAFTGFFSLFTADEINVLEKSIGQMIVAMVGLFLSVGWLLSNKAAKFWQENWENHVYLLEEDVMGPLYKTTLWT
jgi:hypothetical protein